MSDPSTPSGGWRADLERMLHGATLQAEEAFEKGRARLRELFPDDRDRYIQPYRGYATETLVHVSARVLQQKPAGGPQDDDQWWDNLLNTYRRWETDEVPNEAVTFFLDGERIVGESDEEGYVHFALPIGGRVGHGGLWHEGHLVLGSPEKAPTGELQAARVEIMTPGPDADFAVISDVDDTVLHTGITSLVTAAKLTFLGNAKTRKPLGGAATLYRLLQRGGHGEAQPRNPIFYVSSSPWNLYDLIEQFFELNDIPKGPLLLRDFGVDKTKFIKGSHRHKLEKALRLVDAYPDLPFLLVGDSGQEDAKLYAELVAERPGRVQAVYIRDVDPDLDSARDAIVEELRDATGDVPLLRVADSPAIAAHLVGLGLLPSSAIPEIEAAHRRDEGRPKV